MANFLNSCKVLQSSALRNHLLINVKTIQRPISFAFDKKELHLFSTSKNEKIIPQIRNINTRSRHAPRDGRFGPSVRLLLHHYGINWTDVKPSGPYHFLLKSDVLKHIKKGNLMPYHRKHQQHEQQQHKHHNQHHHEHKHEHSQINLQPVQQVDQIEQIAKVEVNQFIKLPINQSKVAIPMAKINVIENNNSYIDNELTGMRKVIAERLTYSKTTIPHSYMVNNCNINKVNELRKKMKTNNINVSINDFIIKASALALKQVKQLNVEFDQNNNKITQHNNVDISIAVAIKNGLITPIIKSADQLTVQEISSEVKKLVDKARNNKLMPHEFQGGTFSISNLGMFGIKEFTAVINPPQAAILAVGGTKFIPDALNVGKINQSIALTISYDLRIVNDSDAAKFMDCLRSNLESPESMLIVSKW